MRIAIDISDAAFFGTGIRSYIFNLLKYILKIDSENEFLLLSNKNIINFNFMTDKCLLVKKDLSIFKKFRNTVFNLFYLPKYIDKHKADIVFIPTNPVDPLPKFKVPLVSHVHDIIPLIMPNLVTKTYYIKAKIFLKRSLSLSDIIICQSLTTKKDLLEMYDISEDKIRVVYLGIDESFRVIYDENIKSKIREKYKLPTKFILQVGTIEPRKNHVLVIKSFYRLKKRGIPHKLLIVGRKGKAIQEVLKNISSLNLNDEVILLENVPDEDLPIIYNLAEVLLFPSLYEGFGFPPLEAMACGCPVIVSNRGALPEIVEDAGLIIDPNCEDMIENAILNVIEDSKLKKLLINKGLERVKKFSWYECARQTLQIFKELHLQRQ